MKFGPGYAVLGKTPDCATIGLSKPLPTEMLTSRKSLYKSVWSSCRHQQCCRSPTALLMPGTFESRMGTGAVYSLQLLLIPFIFMST